MSLLRNVAGDLVAKRLWPVALALVLAIVAVPVLLGGGGEPALAPAASAAAPGETAEGRPGLLTLAQDDGRLVRRRGAKDPFRAPAPAEVDAPVASAADAPFAVAGAASDGSGLGGGSGSLGGGFDLGLGSLPGLDDIDLTPIGGGGSGSGGEAPPPKPPVRDDDEPYHVDLRFGPAGDVRALDDVAPLSPLPSEDDPFFVFLGVSADGQTARFLVSSDAVATGEGTCRPSPERCEGIELRAGETEYFDFTTPGGEVVQYELVVRRIERGATADATAAAASVASVRSGSERADVRYGGAADALVAHHGLHALAPLPDAEDPPVVFLGAAPGGEAALFLNLTGAPVSGDGVCRPGPEACSAFEVPVGGTATLAAPAPGGATVEHHLAVDALGAQRGDAAGSTPTER